MLRGIRSMAAKAVSFVTSLIILIALTVTVLFLLKIKPYVVITPSMEPAVPLNSVCFVNEKFPLEDIAVGDVISFRLGSDSRVTHRVSAISGGQYFTKGDANQIEDSAPVTAENYIGKTVLVIPKVGILLTFLHTLCGKIIAGTVIVLLAVISFLPKKKTEQESKPAE